MRLFSGLITTTARKLDRENQAEHILEVCMRNMLCFYFFFILFTIFPHMDGYLFFSMRIEIVLSKDSLVIRSNLDD